MRDHCLVGLFFISFYALSLFVLFPLLLNSATSSGACTSTASSHELSLAEYPIPLIRKCILHPQPLGFSSRIFSTLYSSSPLIRSGGGRVKFGPCSSVSLYCHDHGHVQYFFFLNSFPHHLLCTPVPIHMSSYYLHCLVYLMAIHFWA